jgi:DNA modification methylase
MSDEPQPIPDEQYPGPWKRREVIGLATLYWGDCREIVQTLARPAAVITDPPYSVSVAGSISDGPRGTRNLDFFAGDTDWRAMRAAVVERLSLCADMKPPTIVAWSGHRQTSYISDALEDRGYATRILVWRKQCPPPATPRSGFSSAVETAVYAYLPGRHWAGGQYEPNIYEADALRHGNPDKVGHPTQKPLSLMAWNIRLLVPPGGVILDPYMGSGTTGVAAVQMRHPFIGIEIEERYFHIACRRIAEAQRQGDLFRDAVA